MARELVRQTWHMLPGLIPFLFWIHPHTDPLSDAFRWISLGVAGTVSLIVFVRIQGVLRPSEGRGGEAVLGYALCVLGTLWMFPEHGELGMTVLAVLAASLAGAAAESLPGQRLNDNIRVGLAAAAAVAVTHHLLVG